MTAVVIPIGVNPKREDQCLHESVIGRRFVECNRVYGHSGPHWTYSFGGRYFK